MRFHFLAIGVLFGLVEEEGHEQLCPNSLRDTVLVANESAGFSD